MGITISPADDADMDRLFEILSLAFQRNEPVWDAMYPYHWTAEGRKHGAERLRDTKKNDAHAIFIKAVDEDTGEIAGMAKWLIFQNAFPGSTTPDAKYWPTEADYQYYQDMVPVFLAQRSEALKRTNGNLVSLDLLTVDPTHQKKGVGQALVKWGIDKADALGLEAVVESSVYGKRLYEKNGFVFKKQVEVAVPGKTDRAPGVFAWLERPKQSS